jgi:hypothetical protein
LAQLDLDTLTDESEKLLGPDLTERTCDLLFRASLKDCDAFLFVLNEHQTNATHEALARFFFYAARALERWTAANKGWTHLPPLICLLVYPGPGAWSAPSQFRDLFSVPDALSPTLSPFLPAFQILVDDLDKQADEELQAREGGALAKLCWLLLKHARTSSDLESKLRAWGVLLREVSESPRDLAAVARYTLIASPLTPNQVRATFRDVAGPAAEEAVVTAGEQLIEKGREKGRLEGERRLLLRQLRVRFGNVTPEVEARIGSASEAELETWSERVLTVASLDEIFAA